MAFQRKKYNPKTKTTYVYDVVSYWDASTKTPRSHSKLIGKVDPVTGEVVPTGKRGRPRKADTAPGLPAPDAADETRELKQALIKAQKEKIELENACRESREEVKRLNERIFRLTASFDGLKKSFEKYASAVEDT